jgi:hypothetical protein
MMRGPESWFKELNGAELAYALKDIRKLQSLTPWSFL